MFVLLKLLLFHTHKYYFLLRQGLLLYPRVLVLVVGDQAQALAVTNRAEVGD